VSESSEKKVFRIPKYKRFEVYVEGKRHGLTNARIAELIGISERMLDRHIAQWKEDGSWDKWVFAEWIITYDQLHQQEDLKTVFEALTKFLLKRMKDQSEVEIKSIPHVIVEVLDNVQPKNESHDTENMSTQKVAVQIAPNTTNSPQQQSQIQNS